MDPICPLCGYPEHHCMCHVDIDAFVPEPDAFLEDHIEAAYDCEDF
jgi:hypothetical protein